MIDAPRDMSLQLIPQEGILDRSDKVGYFLINEDVVDRNDLTIEEKMACVVLARFADIKVLQALLSLDIIAVKMGCSVERSQKAIDGLIRKGVLKSTVPVPSAIISRSKGAQMPTYVYQALEGESERALQINQGSKTEQECALEGAFDSSEDQKQTHLKIDADSIQILKDYFEEIVSESHVRLLLNLTKGHVDPVKKAYDTCRHYPPSQRIDQVADLLQTKIKAKEVTPKSEVPSSKDLFKRPPQESERVKEQPMTTGQSATKAPSVTHKQETESKSEIDEFDALFQELGDSREIKQLNQQINVKRIKQMYGTYGKKP